MGGVWHPTVDAAFAALQRDMDGTTYKFGNFELSRCEDDDNVYQYIGPSLELYLHVSPGSFTVSGSVDLIGETIRFSSGDHSTLEAAYSAVREKIATAKVVLASVQTLIK